VTVEEAPDRTDAGLCFLSERRRTRISSSVRSGSAATNSISHCLCSSNGERLCLVPGLASTFPVSLQRSIHRIVSKRRG
jgi:hypothetical protein